MEEFISSQPIGAFSSGPNMNTARYNMASIGTSTAALAVGGRAPVKSENEEWNGTAWTEKADLNSGRHSMSSSGDYYIWFSKWWRRYCLQKFS